MTHNENIQTFEAISKHLEMEEDRLKAYTPSNVVFVAKGNGPKGNNPCRGEKPKKGPHLPHENSRSKGGFVNEQKAKGKGENNVACVKCYHYVKKGHFTRDCPEPAKVPLSTKMFELDVYCHAFVISLPQWFLDTGVTKHIVQDKTIGFVEFYHYPVGS